jgi:signal transduction histidine kinase
MLAAMSHDPRTPLNRIRLRAEFIEDVEQQCKLFSDLEAMNTMIDSMISARPKCAWLWFLRSACSQGPGASRAGERRRRCGRARK